ncbi:MAG: hypothetical protein ACRD29_00025 [Acidimicrobiales bacterium]
MNPTAPRRVLAAPGGDSARFGPDSDYGAQVWLAVIGPSSWTLWQRLARGAMLHPAGWTTSLEELAGVLGLGSPRGTQAGIARALRRLDRFGIAREVHDGLLVVRCRLPFVSPGQLQRLHPAVQAVHHRLRDRCLAPCVS